ncbi:hypothetical protein KFK09_021335 [Dendrobium nobile]|uniref:Uncharacterized protein n=1 Tax=Dendrobium nobile TaxID=94219 RepID=A0A8T3AQ35_DENNO|nr:hypothetical protein KFK09_021335 [Dendrobium nobile]
MKKDLNFLHGPSFDYRDSIPIGARSMALRAVRGRYAIALIFVERERQEWNERGREGERERGRSAGSQVSPKELRGARDSPRASAFSVRPPRDSLHAKQRWILN